jgi:hypothetical protein
MKVTTHCKLQYSLSIRQDGRRELGSAETNVNIMDTTIVLTVYIVRAKWWFKSLRVHGPKMLTRLEIGDTG